MTAGRVPASGDPADWRHGLFAAALGGYFLLLAVLGVSATYRAPDLLLFAVLYLSLGFLAHFSVQLLFRFTAIGAAAGAAVVAMVAVWHFREQTRSPSLGGLVAPWLVATLVLFLLERRLSRLPARRPALVVGLASFSFVLALGVGFYGSNVSRWHLLRHNTLLGTPLYYLLAEPVPAIRQALFAGQPEAPAPPAGQDTSLLGREAGPGPPSTSRNIVFVLIDTLRADALAEWGGDPALMPRLNEVIARSYRFTDVLANSSWTRPSVASFFTGLLPEEHGARDVDEPLSPLATTLAEALQGLGYQTAAFVTNVAALGRDAGFDQGFDLYRELPGKPYARAEELNAAVIEWLASRRPATEMPASSGIAKNGTLSPPLFLYLHYLDPHEPYLSGKAPRSPSAAQYRRAYAAELRYLDGALAALLPVLHSQLASPLVFLTSDHGEEFFEHGLFGHGHSLYDEVVHIPAALSTGDSGGRIDARLEARDFFDLMLVLAAEPESSAAAWAASRQREERYLSLYHTGSGRLWLRPYLRHVTMRAVDRHDRRLLWSAYGDTWELYDALRDRGERDNLAGVEPERVVELRAGLDRHPRAWFVPDRLRPTGDMRRQLEALGYIEEDDGEGDDEDEGE